MLEILDKIIKQFKIKKPNLTIEMKIIRADGTVENKGIVCEGYTEFKIGLE